MDKAQTPLERINDPALRAEERLAALAAYEAVRRSSRETQAPTAPSPFAEINNHIHTIYSFSPYTPTMAALKARDAGLAAAGSVDHDSIAAAGEMRAACRLLGLGCCTGFELRVSFRKTAGGRFAARKINNPDSPGLAYMTIQGIPERERPRIEDFLKAPRARRDQRGRLMSAAINERLAAAGLRPIDFDKDVSARSQAANGGSITERHLLAALADILIESYGRGQRLIQGLDQCLGAKAPESTARRLAEPDNIHYRFDLIGFLKAAFLDSVFIQPDEAECLPARQVVAFAMDIGAVPAYAYLGDVGESPTGDKKAEKFEDAYLDELFDELADIGYRAIAYMPPRNSLDQLRRVRRLCAEHGFIEISGVDINSSRQSFNCPEVRQAEFRHLIDSTWALVAHECLSEFDPALGFFHPDNPLAACGLAAHGLAARIAAYAAAGRAIAADDLAQAGTTLTKGQAGFSLLSTPSSGLADIAATIGRRRIS